MGQSLNYKRRLNQLAGRIGAQYIRFVHHSSQIVGDTGKVQEEAGQHHPCIYAFWHGQFMMIPTLSPPEVPVANMVARHGDAELIGEALKSFKMELIRGSGAGGRKKDHGGASAMRAAVRALEDGTSVAMTADIPPGPARIAGIGVVKLAQLSSRPIIPVAVASSRFWALRTWSRMTINLPFSRLGVAIGDAIYVSDTAGGEEIEATRRAVEAALNEVTAQVYDKVGGDLFRATPHTALPWDAPAEPAGIKLAGYRAATRIAAKAAPLVLRHRERRGKEDAERKSERLGVASRPRPDGALTWFHAASVGETNAILPLLEALRGKRPDMHFLVTTGTVTSAALAAERLPQQDIHQYAPLDAPQCIERFLDHWRPGLAVLTESEIWPNTIMECYARKIPIAVVNARMSDRSFRRWRSNKSLAYPLFNRLRMVLAQNATLARRFQMLGARTTMNVGNLKIDAPPLPIDSDKRRALAAAITDRPIWVAASTHPGEDEIVLAAHCALRQSHARLLTIIAPRHPERGADVSELASNAGLSAVQRSADRLPSADTEIYIADTIGELGLLYALSSIAFIGGSLIKHGGQNPVEAVRFDSAVISGPNQQNFTDAYRELVRHGGLVEVEDGDQLTHAVDVLLHDDVERARLTRGAHAALEVMSGALSKTAEALLPLLPDPEKGLQRAS